MRVSIVSSVLVFFMFMLMFPQLVYSAQVQSFALIKRSRHGQLVIKTVGKVQHPRVFTLAHPYRIIIDLPDTHLDNKNAINSLGKAHGQGIHNIRYGMVHSSNLRLVLDMDSSSHYQPELLQRNGTIYISLVADQHQGSDISRASSSATKVHMSPDAGSARRNVVIVIDPGHGGKDSGTIGHDGTYEKNVVLPIGKDVERYLNHATGFKAYLTRTGDYFLTLPQRVVVARKHKADFFISIHANAVDSTSPHGTIVFALSEHGASSTMANWMAHRENTSSMLGGGGKGFLDLSGDSISLRQTLIDLSLSSKSHRSISAGKDLVRSIAHVNHMFTSKVERANFAVLRSPDIPAVLIETDFLSNIRARQRLKNPVFQRQLAKSIAQGISHYFTQHPPRGTWLVWKKAHPHSHLAPAPN